MSEFQSKKNNILYIYGLFFLTLIVFLGVFFPNPYFYVLHDSEPGYFANIVNTYINGYPLDFLHPGISVTYLSSLFLLILPYKEDPEFLLLASRVIIMAINFSLIYLGLLFVNRVSLLSAILVVAFLFIYPASNYFLDILSPDGILVGIGLITCALGLNLGSSERSKATFLWYGVALAFAVTTKFHSILLVLPALVASFFLKRNDANETRPLFLVGLAFVAFASCCAIFTYPFLPMFPFWFTHFTWSGDLIALSRSMLEGMKGNGILVLIGGCVLVVVSLFIATRFNLLGKLKAFRENTTYKAVYLSAAGLFLLAIIYKFISFFINGLTYNEIGAATRNSLPFLGFIMLFLPLSKAEDKTNFKTLAASALLILLISFKGYQNQELYKTSSKTNLDYRSLIEESLSGRDYVVFFPFSRFISKELFILFSDYRYGDRTKMFEDQAGELPFKIDPILRSLRMLNSRYFDIPKDISSKFSYRYINKLLSLEYISDTHRRLLENSLYSLKNKDICNEPYDDFVYGQSFSLVIPDNLSYMDIESSPGLPIKPSLPAKTQDSFTSIGNAEKFISKLTDVWENKCGFEILESKTKIINNKKIFILNISAPLNSK